MSGPRTIALDFDGVLHRYENGWTGDVPQEPPVDGARQAVAALRALGYRVVVFTCRALTQLGRAGTIAWLDAHGIEVDEVTAIKPHAMVYLDDRAVRFEGDWSSFVQAIEEHGTPRPWNAGKKPPPATSWPAGVALPSCGTCGAPVAVVRPGGTYQECGHPIPGAAAIETTNERTE